MKRWTAVAAVALISTGLLTGCDATADKPAAGPSAAPTVKHGGKPVLIKVQIEHGKVTPRAARVNARVGQPVTLEVQTDATEEIHVHSNPEKEFEVAPGGVDRVTFFIDQPGKVAIEVHKLDVTIAEVLVRP